MEVKRSGIYYLTKDGKDYEFVSVTSVLTAIAKPQLIHWAASLSARAVLQDPTISEEEAISSIYIAKKDGASRGSLVHSLVEAADNGAVPDIEKLPPYIRPYALAHQKFIGDFSPKLVHNEQIVVNFTFGYAGTLDRVYEIDGKSVLVDFKTSANYYPEMGLQLAAYKNCEFMFTKDYEYFPMPAIDKTAIVLLGDDATYTYRETNEPLEVFMALKKVYLWGHKSKLERVKTSKKSALSESNGKEENTNDES